MPTIRDVEDARGQIGDQIVMTPCKRSLVLDDLVDCQVFFKYENHQRTGSFKDRGALNRLSRLSQAERARGVVAASAGNHAQALAYHATRLGIPVTVVMPEATPTIKVMNTGRHGARVLQVGATLTDSLETAHALEHDEGLVLVHPYDDPAVVAGQGTLGLELLEQVPDLDAVVVPIGGGGLISGTALAVKSRRPQVRVYGVEAAAAPSARVSREQGRPVTIESSETIADGIAVKRVGDVTFPLIEAYVDEIVEVSENEIASAVLLLLERQKTVVEGAGAVPLAALLSGVLPVTRGERVVAVLAGGNIDINMVSRIIDRGLVIDGRAARLLVTGRDRPGFLARLTGAVAGTGANVLEVSHRRSFADITVGDVEILMHLETRSQEHVGEVIGVLDEMGYSVAVDT
jgi:threonine dehydratase